MRVIWIVPLVAGLGCGTAAPVWQTDLRAAKRDPRPLLVLSIVGDLTKRC